MADRLYKYGFRRLTLVTQTGGVYTPTNIVLLINTDLVRYAQPVVSNPSYFTLYFDSTHNVTVVGPITNEATQHDIGWLLKEH